VAILDADKEGFLRSARSLIQTCGRAARNVGGKVIMYGDKVTRSMQQSIDETNRRRKIQQEYNQRHGITPATIQKDITRTFDFGNEKQDTAIDHVAEAIQAFNSLDDIDSAVKTLEKKMHAAAKNLEFEEAADLRDQIRALQKLIVLES
jgi:excinuclease ABC subunit B